jgi:leucyl aminopeptidase
MVTVCIGPIPKLLRPNKTFAKLSESTVEKGSDSIGGRMKVEVRAPTPESFEADVLALALPDGGPALPAVAKSLDEALDGRLGRLVAEEEVAQAIGRTAVLHPNGELDARRVVVVGLGPSAEIDADALRTAAARVSAAADRVGGSLAWLLDDSLDLSLAEQARAIVDGLVLGAYDPGRWKREAKELPFDRLVLIGGEEAKQPAQRAVTVAEATNRARDLANTGANELTPEKLAARAQDIASERDHLTAEALGPEQIEKLGMGAFAGVAQGSHNPARLIVMRYDPPQSNGDTVLGLVGKAVTFDTGGISIKPALYMEDMKGDMAGGAAVVEGLGAIAELGLPVRVIAVVAATENMVGGGAYRPGDVLRAMNGKTIEITNTDAEGRLILADALHYAREQGATHLVDFATLTGAMEKALGDLYAGVFGNEDSWRDEVVAAGEASGDHAWPWPMHRRYRGYIESAFADMKNSSVRGQAIPAYAASFLEEFVGEGPWAHVDMAGTGFYTWPRNDYLGQKGGSGYGVRLIVELASRLTR